MTSPQKLLCHTLLIAAGTLGAQTHTWEKKANGQELYDCDPAHDPGGEFYAPTNSNWGQDQLIGNHPCTGDPGFQREPSNWNTPGYPNSPGASVLIDSGPPVLIDVSVSVGSLQLTGGNSIRLPQNSTFSVYNSIINDGMIEIDDDANNYFVATLEIAGNVNLTGSGTILFKGGDDNRLTSLGATNVLTIGADQLLVANAAAQAGDAHSRIQAAFTNNGTIRVNEGGLQIDTHPKTNNNVIEAVNGGYLIFRNTTLDNSLGTITAAAGCTIDLDNASFSGGSINGGGTYDVLNSDATFDGSANVLTFESTALIDKNDALTLRGTVLNEGMIRLNALGSGGSADLRIDGNVTLNGAGQVIFESGNDNYILSADPGDILTIGSNQTLIASANAVAGNNYCRITAATTNNGTITADEGGLQLDTYPKTNNSLIQSVNGGNLRFDSVTVNNTMGTIMIDPAGTLLLHDATVTGGLIDGEGAIAITAAPSTLQDLTIGPGLTADIPNNHSLKLAGTVTNNGTITISDQGPGQARLQVSGNVGLGGTGTIVFNTKGANYLESTDPADTLTVLAGQTLTTSSTSEVGASLLRTALVNEGLVEARIGSLTLDANDKTNNGTFRAVNGGELEIRSASTILTNYGARTLTGGRWEVISNGLPTTMDIQGTTINTIGPGTEVLLSGANASFPALLDNLDSNEGHLALHDGRSLTTGFDFDSSGRLEFGLPHVSPTTWDSTLIDANGNVDLTGCVIDIVNLGITNGRYRIIRYSGGLTGAPTLGNVPAGMNCSLDASPTGSIDLVVTGAPVPDPVILDFEYNPATNTATITYQSVNGETYGVLGGTNPDSLSSLGDTAIGDGSIMDHLHPLPANTTEYFYRMTR